jgi:hypothetical protein
MIWKCVAAVALAVFAAPSHATDAARTALTELRAAEAQALEQAQGKPPSEAIVALLSDDTRLYARGGPFVGRELALKNLQANPGNRGTETSWRALKSGASSDGTHAFTLGYFDIAGGDPAIAGRFYLAYWMSKAGGWRLVALKQGLRTPSAAPAERLPDSIPLRGPAATPDPEAARQSLIAAEKAFSDRAQVAGIGLAFTEFGRADAVNGGTVGAAAIGAGVSGGENGPSPVNWSADEVLVAPSGDLGISFGMIRPNQAPPPGQPAATPFFTVWMRDGPDQPWRYVAE